jgi:hypothetical protein
MIVPVVLRSDGTMVALVGPMPWIDLGAGLRLQFHDRLLGLWLLVLTVEDPPCLPRLEASEQPRGRPQCTGSLKGLLKQSDASNPLSARVRVEPSLPGGKASDPASGKNLRLREDRDPPRPGLTGPEYRTIDTCLRRDKDRVSLESSLYKRT